MSRYGFALRDLSEPLRTQMAEQRKRFHLRKFLVGQGIRMRFGNEWETDLMTYFAKQVKRGEFKPAH